MANDKDKDKGCFMNLMTDYAFKWMFGEEGRKPILLRLLNILFADDGIHVTDVTYHNVEVLPDNGEGKKIVYDVFCTNKIGREHFILEMQQIYHPLFEDRAVFYTTKALARQLKKGHKYSLRPVYSIFLVDFPLRHLGTEDFHDVRLVDIRSNKVFSDKLRMLFVHLSEAKKDWDQCKTEFDKIVFIIKNMHKMDKNSKAYKSGEFYDMFNEAEIESMAEEQIQLYSASRLRLEEMMEAVDYASEENFAKGLAEGKAEGNIEGKEEVARNMLAKGYSLDEIKALTGISL